MSYCTIDDVRLELHPTLKLQMESHYNDGHAQDPICPDFNSFIINHIARADDYVNASLARAFSVPLKKESKIVTSATCKIAAYFATAAFTEKEEILKDKYESANMMLDNLVEAGYIPGIDDEDDRNNVPVYYGTNRRIFTDKELAKW